MTAARSDPAGARDAAMLALLYGGGLRRSEAVDATAGTLTVRHGKGDAARQVYATNGGKDAIDAWLQVRGYHAGALLAPVGKGGRVADRPMTPQAVMMRLRTVAERAGVRRFTPHDSAAFIRGRAPGRRRRRQQRAAARRPQGRQHHPAVRPPRRARQAPGCGTPPRAVPGGSVTPGQRLSSGVATPAPTAGPKAAMASGQTVPAPGRRSNLTPPYHTRSRPQDRLRTGQ